MDKYPYFIYPLVERLDSATGEERRRLCRKIAASVDDRTVLSTLFGIDPEEFRSFYPDMSPVEISTNEAIDTFISRFGDNSAAQSAAEPEEIPVAPPVIDYADSFLAGSEEDKLPADDTSATIDAFLNAVPPKMPKAAKRQKTPEKTPEPEKPRLPAAELSLSFANIMIKKGNYAKALEIITDLSLNNPKKSIYFADQIRFLKKLIENEN